MGTPYVLRFGTYKCGGLSSYTVDFVSHHDGKKHSLKKSIIAPIDRS